MKTNLTVVLVLLVGTILSAVSSDNPKQSYFPSLTPPTSILVARTWNSGQEPPIGLNSNYRSRLAEIILLQSLSGVLLKQGSSEGIFIEPNADHRLILQDLSRRRNISYTYFSGPLTAWDLASHFRTNFGGRYVLCNISANPDSLNIARMAAYKFDAVIVDSLVQSNALSRQWTNVFDASSKDDNWFYTNWWPTWPVKGFAVEQNNDPAIADDYSCLNDYTPATGAPTFFEGTNSPSRLRLNFLQDLAPDSVLIGWPYSSGELDFTTADSLHNVSLVAANWCQNLALLSSLRDTNRLPLVQALCSDGQPLETNVHYVTFVFTDGDNLQWFHNGFILGTNWWGSPSRGHIPLGWGMSPTLRDLSPTITEYLVASAAASNNPARDTFLAMSPVGYCYPSMFSASARATNATRLAGYMHDLDLSTLVLLDNAGFETPSVYLPYLQQPQINAIFYWDAFGNYAKYAGAIQWQNGKPIIAALTNMWGSSGPAEVAAALNARPRNPRSLCGYSMVDVHAWTHTVADVSQCIQLLDPHLKVVTPDVFVSLIRRSIGPEVWSPAANIDLGEWQRASYGSPSTSSMTISVNCTNQSVDGSPSTHINVGNSYAFTNMKLPSILNFDAALTLLEFDLFGDNSGSLIRLELWSDTLAAFLYVDVALNFNGWRHFAFRLDGSDGLQVWNATPQQVASSVNIWQVSGPWNGIPATFFLDNARLVTDQSGMAQPQLTIIAVGPQLCVSWPARFAGFKLQAMASLGGSWLPFAGFVLNTNCECSTMISPTNIQRFFRLSQI